MLCYFVKQKSVKSFRNQISFIVQLPKSRTIECLKLFYNGEKIILINKKSFLTSDKLF